MWLIDISRLVENLHLATPTGIDRVEMAYAQHFLVRADREDVRFVVTWPHFTGLLSARDAKPIIDEMAARWNANERVDASFEILRSMLNEPVDVDRRRPQRIGLPDTRRFDDWKRMASVWLRSAAKRLNETTIAELRAKVGCYIHASQFRLNYPQRFEWVSEAVVESLFVVHDLIPITHPEYCRAGEAERHRARLETVMRHATTVIAISNTTRQALKSHFKGKNDLPPCKVVPLGLAPVFAKTIEPLPSERPYFVVVGTIEPRKNLLFLLTVWHRWTRAGQDPRARLVIVGRRGWENENIVDLLDRSAGLAPTVIEAGSLGDAGMAALLKGAAALIAPSFVEGYGLPIAEALALGVPVIASDIDAHREAGGAYVDYLDPLDGAGWMQAFDDYVERKSERRRKYLAALKKYKAPTWSRHLSQVETIVSELKTQMPKVPTAPLPTPSEPQAVPSA